MIKRYFVVPKKGRGGQLYAKEVEHNHGRYVKFVDLPEWLQLNILSEGNIAFQDKEYLVDGAIVGEKEDEFVFISPAGKKISIDKYFYEKKRLSCIEYLVAYGIMSQKKINKDWNVTPSNIAIDNYYQNPEKNPEEIFEKFNSDNIPLK